MAGGLRAEVGSNCGELASPCGEHAIEGTVFDAGLNPVAGASVRGPWGIVVTTDAGGRYRLYVDTVGVLPITVEVGGAQLYATTVTFSDPPQSVVVNFAPPGDTTPPETTIDSAPSSSTSSSTAQFSFSCNEAGCGFECQLNGGSFSACTSPVTYSGLPDGAHSFAVRAVDPANLRDATPASWSWTISGGGGGGGDTTPPETTILDGPASTTTSTDATFTFGCSESNCSFECRLDGGTYVPCTSPQSYGSLGVGAHTFDVRATDGAGNVDATPASWSWTIGGGGGGDTTPPETTILDGPASTTTSTDATFTFGCSESNCSFECRLDGGTYVPCTSPQSYGSLSVGAHTFDVRATDGAGNVDATPASWSWTIDTTVGADDGSGTGDTTPPEGGESGGPTTTPSGQERGQTGGGGCSVAWGADSGFDIGMLMIFLPALLRRRRARTQGGRVPVTRDGW